MPNENRVNSSLVVCMYVYYDKKVKAYDVPFFAQNDVNAKRKFITDAKNPNIIIGQFTEEFELFYVGDFDPQTGIFWGGGELPDMKVILTGKEVKAHIEKEIM